MPPAEDTKSVYQCNTIYAAADIDNMDDL